MVVNIWNYSFYSFDIVFFLCHMKMMTIQQVYDEITEKKWTHTYHASYTGTKTWKTIWNKWSETWKWWAMVQSEQCRMIIFQYSSTFGLWPWHIQGGGARPAVMFVGWFRPWSINIPTINPSYWSYVYHLCQPWGTTVYCKHRWLWWSRYETMVRRQPLRGVAAGPKQENQSTSNPIDSWPGESSL